MADAAAGNDKAQAILNRQRRLRADRATLDSLWSRVGDLAMPFHNINRVSSPTLTYAERIYDSTLPQANFICASGVTTNTTPATDQWFALETPPQLRAITGGSEDADRWLQECTEILHRELASSNFYAEILPVNAERSLFGTCNLFTEEGRDTLFRFLSIPISTYDIAWSFDGKVDTVFREFRLSARQAEQEFGRDNLSPKIKEALESTDTKQQDKEFTLVHAVYPRADAERDPYRRDGLNKPFASCYVCSEDQYVVRESGYDEFPYAVSRWDVWPGQVWGWSPGLLTLPVAKQLNALEKNLDLLVEKKVDPRVLVPQSMVGLVNFRAGGITVFDENNQAGKPEEWMSVGDFKIGQERGDQKRKEVRDAFHNDLFQMFSQLERDITAFEAAQRAGEKLDVFIPIFQRLTSELLSPTIMRCFGIAFRAGYFPPPPAEVFVPNAGGVALAIPQVQYTSKMSLAIRALQNRSLDSFLARLAPLAQAKPDLLDYVNDEALVPAVARNDGVPASWIRTTEEVQAIRQARAEAIQAQQAAELMQATAKSAADLGKAPPRLQSAVQSAIDV